MGAPLHWGTGANCFNHTCSDYMQTTEEKITIEPHHDIKTDCIKQSISTTRILTYTDNSCKNHILPLVTHIPCRETTLCFVYVQHCADESGSSCDSSLDELQSASIACRQVSVEVNYTGTPYVLLCILYLIYIRWELQLQQCWSSWWWLLYSLQSSGISRGELQVTMIVYHKIEERDLAKHVHCITQVQTLYIALLHIHVWEPVSSRSLFSLCAGP